MRTVRLLIVSLIFVLLSSTASFAWSGWVKDFTISNITLNSFGNVEVWGRGPAHKFDVKLVVPNNDPNLNRLLSIILTAKSSSSKINAYSFNGRLSAVTIQ